MISFNKFKNVLRFKEKEGPTRTIIVKDSIGTSGNEIYSGYYSDDYLTSLRGVDRAEAFDKMRRSDPQVKMLLSAVKNPIKRASWEVMPFDDSEESKQDARLIEKILFEDLKTTWSKFINEALTMIDFGFSAFFRTHKIVKNDPEFGSYVGINDISFRSQKTIERWIFEENELKFIEQQAYGDLEASVSMSINDMIIFTPEMEGSNYEGISFLRPCYGNFFRKNIYLKLNAIGIEKFAVPTPIATIPAHKTGGTEKTNLESVLQKYVTHQSNYLIKPEGYEIDLKTNT